MGRWSFSAESASSATLMELYQLLKASEENRPQALQIQRELVRRARVQGLTTRQIVRALVGGVGKKRERALIVKEWCEALGLTEAEAKRIAGQRSAPLLLFAFFDIAAMSRAAG